MATARLHSVSIARFRDCARIPLLALALLATSLDAATLLVTNTNDSGAGSLRAAVVFANNTVAPDNIQFNIPGAGPHVIALASNLPTIVNPLTIDGYTQPGAAANSIANVASNAVIKIQLNALASVGNPGRGLSICSSNVTIRGLSITNFRMESIGTGVNVGSADCDEISENIVISGNFLGLNPDGAMQTGLSFFHLSIRRAAATVGGATPASRNVIAGGDANGIFLSQGSTGTMVDGNLIGTDPSATQPRSDGNGIQVFNTFAVRIGTLHPNFIAFNLRGITVLNTSTNTIGGNFILFNDGLGIDLGGDGVTPNDLNDVDEGANRLQNFPELSLAQLPSIGLMRVVGRLDVPIGTNANYGLTVYQSTDCDSSGHGEGSMPLATVSVPMVHLGAPTFNRNESFDISVPRANLGSFVTLTATEPEGSTSEFSRCIEVVGPDQMFRNGFEP